MIKRRKGLDPFDRVFFVVIYFNEFLLSSVKNVEEIGLKIWFPWYIHENIKSFREVDLFDLELNYMHDVHGI